MMIKPHSSGHKSIWASKRLVLLPPHIVKCTIFLSSLSDVLDVGYCLEVEYWNRGLIVSGHYSVERA